MVAVVLDLVLSDDEIDRRICERPDLLVRLDVGDSEAIVELIEHVLGVNAGEVTTRRVDR